MARAPDVFSAIRGEGGEAGGTGDWRAQNTEYRVPGTGSCRESAGTCGRHSARHGHLSGAGDDDPSCDDVLLERFEPNAPVRGGELLVVRVVHVAHAVLGQ